MCIKLKLFGVWCAALPEDVSLFWQPSSEALKVLVGTAGPLGWTRGDAVTWGSSTPSPTSQTGLGHGSSEHGEDIAWTHATVGTSPRSGQVGHLHPNECWPAFGQGNICFPYSDLLLGEVLPKPHQDLAFPLPAQAEFSSFWVESPARRPGGGIQAVPSPRPLRPAIHRSHQVWPSCMHDVSGNVCVRGFKLQICVTKEFPILLHVFPCLYRSPPFFLLAVKQHKETLCMLLILKQHSFSNIQG